MNPHYSKDAIQITQVEARGILTETRLHQRRLAGNRLPLLAEPIPRLRLQLHLLLRPSVRLRRRRPRTVGALGERQSQRRVAAARGRTSWQAAQQERLYVDEPENLPSNNDRDAQAPPTVDASQSSVAGIE